MIKKEGKFPVNARVDVDYSGKKPKIKFGYTSNNPKKDAMDQHSLGLHSLIILVFIYSALVILVMFVNFNIEGNYPEQCSNVTFDEASLKINISIEYSINGNTTYSTTFTDRKEVRGANITCDGKIYKIKFSKDINLFELNEKGFYNDRSRNFGLIYGGYFLSIFFLIGALWYYLNKLVTYLLLKSERYRKAFPKFQAKLYSKRKYIKFKSKDVENKMVEIPCFSNVVLEYKASGDFSKQLQKIKIREHTHYDFKKGKKSKKIKRNINHWYARFFFKETPKDGYLEVIYR